VEGAGNLGITSSSFRDDLSRLNHDASYVVYCQSGNPSPAAVEVMREQRLVDVADAGAYAALTAADASSAS
jgi:rhodanese-related sulfurtransferase